MRVGDDVMLGKVGLVVAALSGLAYIVRLWRVGRPPASLILNVVWICSIILSLLLGLLFVMFPD